MDLRPTDNYPVGAALDYSRVVIGVRLAQRPGAAVALGIGLRDRNREVIVAAVLVERLHALEVIRFVLLIYLARDAMEGEEGIGSDFFHKHNQRLAKGRGGLD